MRPMMTNNELIGCITGTAGRDYAKSDDGYSDMEVARDEGWREIANWGRDGWDLGDWPYVVVYAHRLDNRRLRVICEGDSTFYAFGDAEARDAAIDFLFIFYGLGKDFQWEPWLTWSQDPEAREKLDDGALVVPDELRGPYHPSRSVTT